MAVQNVFLSSPIQPFIFLIPSCSCYWCIFILFTHLLLLRASWKIQESSLRHHNNFSPSVGIQYVWHRNTDTDANMKPHMCSTAAFSHPCTFSQLHPQRHAQRHTMAILTSIDMFYVETHTHTPTHAHTSMNHTHHIQIAMGIKDWNGWEIVLSILNCMLPSW